MKRSTILIAGLIVLVVILAAGCATTPKGTEVSGKTNKGNKITVDQLAKIAPGAGTMMMEIGNRWWALWFAGTNGNWDLAAYEVEETEEAMDVINTTRPKLKNNLESFLSSHKSKLEDAIKAKDTAKFKSAFNKATKGCNACHKATQKDFIEWQVPDTAPPFLNTKPVK